ncbi:MAG: adenosylcobinamide-GDP ribazoletransferase [Candidatus Methanoperedens sp.]|nr:adenosylcobinamide-GDP ribazoletransferase [Candidatus Methanoperedens sp.]MCE8425847.1 adenosylcobinamide-GDP ribazoletransferase [Candidatus Methanoperedens sp.]MCE8427635.1 adenosylcobinamide-GDP ribazoletransferase [Candidatus Methanoperedens sp.]
MIEFFSALRSGFGFLTTIPVGIDMEGIEKLMKHIYLFPVVGAVTGIILALIAYAAAVFFPVLLISVILIISIYYLTGFNHIDGLADFGDGLAAHGTREKKIKAMRDTAVGTGGVVVCIIALLSLYSSLASIPEIILPLSLVVAETSAKQSMITVAAFGRKLHEGFGSMTVDNTKRSDFIIGMVFSGAVNYLLLGITGIEALIIAQLAGLLVLNTANRHFGGVSGDIVGATNEIGRVAALLAITGAQWMQF